MSVLLFIDLEVGFAKIWDNGVCLFILETVVGEYLSEDFVKFFTMWFIKSECIFLLSDLFLLLKLLLLLISLILDLLVLNLFNLSIDMGWLLVNQLYETSEDNNYIFNMRRVSQKVFENYTHSLK